MQMEQNNQYAAAGERGQHPSGNGNLPMQGRNTAESERTLATNDVRTVNGVKYEPGQPAPVASNF